MHVTGSQQINKLSRCHLVWRWLLFIDKQERAASFITYFPGSPLLSTHNVRLKNIIKVAKLDNQENPSKLYIIELLFNATLN